MQLEKKYRALILAAVSCAMLSFVSQLHNMEGDTVRFSGDEWNYQALGVNIALGHGYVEGAAEPFERYKFHGVNKNAPFIIDGCKTCTRFGWFNGGPRYIFKRTPGYPALIAAVYSVAGISPHWLRVTQAALNAITAGMMVILGFAVWSVSGMAAGIIASIIFILYYKIDPSLVLTEPLIAAILSLVAFSLIGLERQKFSQMSAILAGAVTGLSLLVKGLMIFLPILIAANIVFLAPRDRRFRSAVWFVAAVGLVIAPWSYYASQKAGRLVVLSVQADELMIDGNNELALEKGGWQPEWRKTGYGDAKFMAWRPPYNGMSASSIVLHFWYEHLTDLPRFFFAKFWRAFGSVHFGLPAALVVLYYLLLAGKKRSGTEVRPIYPGLFLINLIGIILLFSGDIRYAVPFLPYFVLTGCYVVVRAAAVIFNRQLGRTAQIGDEIN